MYNKAHKDGEGVDEQLHGVTVSCEFFVHYLRICNYRLFIVCNGVPSSTLHIKQNGAYRSRPSVPAGELDKLIDALGTLSAQGELTFKNIQKAVLQVHDGILGGGRQLWCDNNGQPVHGLSMFLSPTLSNSQWCIFISEVNV